jgi:hypothetical protein
VTTRAHATTLLSAETRLKPPATIKASLRDRDPGSAGSLGQRDRGIGTGRQGCRRSCACDGEHTAGWTSPSGRKFTGL